MDPIVIGEKVQFAQNKKMQKKKKTLKTVKNIMSGW
jgi:hypothetical protein